MKIELYQKRIGNKLITVEKRKGKLFFEIGRYAKDKDYKEESREEIRFFKSEVE